MKLHGICLNIFNASIMFNVSEYYSDIRMCR